MSQHAAQRKQHIDKAGQLSVVRQCDLLEVHRSGYLYLVAVIDLYSRYVLNWSLSNTMTCRWCMQALDETIR